MTEAIWFLIQDFKHLKDIFDGMITNNSIVKNHIEGRGEGKLLHENTSIKFTFNCIATCVYGGLRN